MILVLLSIFIFIFSSSRRCPLLATFLSALFCLLSLLISDFRFDLVWFRLSSDYGWICSGSVNVKKTTNNNNLDYDARSGDLVSTSSINIIAFGT